MNSNTRNLVPMAFVKSVPRSIAFCEKFGFRVRNTRAPEGAVGPVIAEKPATLFYLYVDDAAAFRAQLLASGAQADEICFPFSSPKAEFRVTDRGGYSLFISHV